MGQEDELRRYPEHYSDGEGRPRAATGAATSGRPSRIEQLAQLFRMRLPLNFEPTTHVSGTEPFSLELARTAHQVYREHPDAERDARDEREKAARPGKPVDQCEHHDEHGEP